MISRYDAFHLLVRTSQEPTLFEIDGRIAVVMRAQASGWLMDLRVVYPSGESRRELLTIV